MRNHKSIIQFIKFGVVGISNTLITALIIWFLLRILNWSDYMSNFAGYVIGLINSFFWNRKWTFNSNSNVRITVFKFMVTFVISYLIQLGNLYLLLNFTSFDSYICQLLSIIIYTCVNFALNKYYTFKN